MFDDPRKELRRMEAELRAQEEEKQEQEEPLTDLDFHYDFEEDDWLQEAKDLLGPEPPAPQERRKGPRNDAVDFHRMAYADGRMDESTAVYVERKTNKKNAKKKGVGCLPLVAALEIIGITLLGWWWYRWLR